MVVVLPAPFGPRKPVTLPGITSNDRSLTAVTSPYRLVRPRTSIIGLLLTGTVPSSSPPRADGVGLPPPGAQPRQASMETDPPWWRSVHDLRLDGPVDRTRAGWPLREGPCS